MSLIMDALEKVQRDKLQDVSVSETPRENRTKPVDFRPSFAPSLVPAAKESKGHLTAVSKDVAVLLLALAIPIFSISTLVTVGWSAVKKNAVAAKPSPPWKVSLPDTPASLPALEGIVRDGKSAFCLLGGRIFRAGDRWRDYSVQSIEARSVVLSSSEGRVVKLWLAS